MAAATLAELKRVIALRDVPEEHLQWILDNSQYYEYEDGTPILRSGAPTTRMMFILGEAEGHTCAATILCSYLPETKINISF